MIVDVQNSNLMVKPQTMDEMDFLIDINKIIKFQVQDGWWITSSIDLFIFKQMAIQAKMTKWDKLPGFNQWMADFRPQEVIEIQCNVHETKIDWKNTNKLVEEEIYKKLSYFFKPATNDWRYKKGMWDGYIRLYNKRSKTLPTGLVYLVTEYLDKCKLRYVVCNHYETKPEREFDWVANDKVIPEEDQVLAVSMADKFCRGLLKAPTGFGKTAVLAVRSVANFGVPSLFIANKKSLLDDAKDAFAGLIDNIDETKIHQIKDGIFGTMKIKKETQASDIPELDSHIIVATVQSLHSRLNDPRTGPILKRWLQDVCKFVMIDECQAMGTKQWDEVLNACNAPLRFALSATPRRTDGGVLKIHAQTGDTIFFTTAEEQIAKGRLCELDIQYHMFDHGLYNERDSDVQYQDAYSEWIVNNEKRNAFVVNQVMSLLGEDRLTLLLINFIEHGHVLTEELVKAGLAREDIRFVYGETKDAVRTAAIKEFRKGKFKVLIGSTIFDAGVNIPSISGVVIAGAGNSDITLIQKIGRGARNVDFEKELGYIPEFMIGQDRKITKVVDIYDTNVKFFNKQAKNRFENASLEFGESRVKLVGTTGKITKRKQSKNVTSEQGTEAMMNLLNSFGLNDMINSNTDNNIKATDSQQNLFNIFRR